jgi:hypothetical protein
MPNTLNTGILRLYLAGTNRQLTTSFDSPLQPKRDARLTDFPQIFRFFCYKYYVRQNQVKIVTILLVAWDRLLMVSLGN